MCRTAACQSSPELPPTASITPAVATTAPGSTARTACRRWDMAADISTIIVGHR